MKICMRCMKKFNDGDPVVDVWGPPRHQVMSTVHAFTCVDQYDEMEYPDDEYGYQLHLSGGVPMYPYRQKEISKDGYHNPYGDPDEDLPP